MEERRDNSAILSDVRVSIARIESTQNSQADTLKRLESKLDLGVFREEYERRHKELVDVVTTVANDYQRRIGSERVWKFIFSAAIAVLGVVAATNAFHIYVH